MRQDYKGRPTADLIVIFLTGVIGLLLLGTGLVALFLELTNDEHSNANLLAFTSDVIKSFVGIIIGYIAGRGVSTKNGGAK